MAIEEAQPFGARSKHPAELVQWANATGDADRPDRDRIRITDERRDHILVGEPDRLSGGHKHGSGIPGKTTFPPDWDDKKVLTTIMDVARNPDKPPLYQEDHRTWLAIGLRDDVLVHVTIRPDGNVRTAFPPKGKGAHRNDKNGSPVPLPWPEPE